MPPGLAAPGSGGRPPGSPAPGSAGCPVARLARGWPALLVGPSPFHEELSTAFCRGPHAVARGPAAPEPLAFGIRSRSALLQLRLSVPRATRARRVSVTLRRRKLPSISLRRARIANAKGTLVHQQLTSPARCAPGRCFVASVGVLRAHPWLPRREERHAASALARWTTAGQPQPGDTLQPDRTPHASRRCSQPPHRELRRRFSDQPRWNYTQPLRNKICVPQRSANAVLSQGPRRRRLTVRFGSILCHSLPRPANALHTLSSSGGASASVRGD